MFRFIFLFLTLPILFCSQSNVVLDLFSEATMIEFYKDGNQIEISSSQLDEIDSLFYESISEALSMPAFGVSIDSLTKEAMKTGLWLKFVYDETIIINEMPFDSLLIEIKEDCYGVNIIRGNDGTYNGRCFYLDLNGNNFDKLYQYLVNLTENDDLEIELESQEIEQTEIKENINENQNNNENENEKEKSLLKSKKSLLEKLN